MLNSTSIQKVDNGYIVYSSKSDRTSVFPTVQAAFQQALLHVEGLTNEYINEFGEVLIATKPGEVLTASKPTDSKLF